MDPKNASFADIFVAAIRPLEQPSSDMHQTIKAITLICSLVFLASSFLLNLSYVLNVLCTGKTTVAYFRLVIVYCLFHVIFQVTDCFEDCQEIFVAWLEPSQTLTWLEENMQIISHGALGILFLLVSTLTIERFLSSSVGGVVSICLQLVTSLIAISCPALLVAFQILSTRRPSSTFSLDSEVWFGLEVGIYIILPLLCLTIFGTVNYCKISISSRKMPTYEVAAVKTNIGLVVITNISIFIFLIKECLVLWRVQLSARQIQDDAVKDMTRLVSVALLCVRLGLGLVQAIVPVLMLAITCKCCSTCCCSSINQLEETRYKEVNRHGENVSL